MTILGERTKQLIIFCRVTGFTSDFLSFVVVELILFFHGALRFLQTTFKLQHHNKYARSTEAGLNVKLEM